MQPPRRILLVRLGSLGDVILTTSALRALRRAFPQAELDYWTDRALAQLFAADPDVANVIAVSRCALNRSPRVVGDTLRRLRQRRYDLAIDFQGKWKTAWMIRAAGVPMRIGRTRLDRPRLRPLPGRYVGAEAVAMLSPLGLEDADPRPRIVVSESARRWIQTELAARSVRGNVPLLGIFPGAGWEPRAWPPERFAAVAQRFVRERDGVVLLVGAAKEADRLRKIATALPQERLLLFQDLPLDRLAAAVEACTVFLSNDTGPMHLAVAVGVPTVALFGPGDFSRFAPQFPPHRPVREPIACSPCRQFRDHCRNNACMLLISVQRVWEELGTLLDAVSASSGIVKIPSQRYVPLGSLSNRSEDSR